MKRLELEEKRVVELERREASVCWRRAEAESEEREVRVRTCGDRVRVRRTRDLCVTPAFTPEPCGTRERRVERQRRAGE